jgi:RimJ/RimL family protein N-acetyltransferase
VRSARVATGQLSLALCGQILIELFGGNALPTVKVGPPPIPELPVPWRIRLLQGKGADVDLVHRWMHLPHVAEGFRQAWSLPRWETELSTQLAGDHSRPCVVEEHGKPLAYVEIYRTQRDRIAEYYHGRPHDLGVHIAICDPERIGCGIGTALLRAIADGLFATEADCTTVLAEPDVRNIASVRAFTSAGFHNVGEITLPHKTSALMARPRVEGDLPERRL